MTQQRNDFDEKAYNPTFEWSFLAPKYWGTWLMVLVALPIALLPHSFRYALSNKIAKILVKKRKGNIFNAWVNFKLCFPEKSDSELETLLHKTLLTAGTFALGFARVSLRSRKWLNSKCDIKGIENIENALNSGQKVILLVPHTWAIDIPAILFASMNQPVSAMAKKQKNDVIDWLMHRQRVQYGGRVYERSGGVKPFIKSVRDGYLGYYLPDQDHGPEHSIFVEFFGNQKATLPGLGKLSKVSRAKIVPVFSIYDAESDRYIVDIHPAFEPYPNETEYQDARMMNAFIEQATRNKPEQYMWSLRFFRTQKNNRNIYREFKSKHE
ncbi:lauroyl-Kdo(2)-lipid IV(A) myristoyltransferase [Vibrio sp. CK2-1]|uniref:lauroyl-Kdo(2)-lipid IV(A) myristoyltransferase n=1 Tax=Vibrio sp. CK2-1 TaxID=2912249 RepID=UPI001EEEECFB|nr:lauroyl-Kdo(2)-lipid IV(A) myristoyltransferase [Vibrio sp. CK2-1]MCF7355401.1 lauroyl-Kdo(2)-lipid IV(A) myristoyltransferase [Vibrio sp. CK2-1]